LIIENRLSLNEEGILRKQEGMYIPHRKRGYLYWFKFLQEAERSDDFMVNWIKYRGWGGSNVVLGQKFDEWWEDHWKDFFEVDRLSYKPRFDPTVNLPAGSYVGLSILIPYPSLLSWCCNKLSATSSEA